MPWGHMTEGDDLRVLIVEDEAILGLEIELVLREQGHTVVGLAMDMPTALELGASERPDLALVDLNLRDGPTGPQIARRLVGEHGVNVIFLTANPELIPEGFAGALGAMSKPFDDRALASIMAFAVRFIRGRTLMPSPRRFRLAPWLTTPPDDLQRH